MIYHVDRQHPMLPAGFAVMRQIGVDNWNARVILMTPTGKQIDIGTPREQFENLRPPQPWDDGMQVRFDRPLMLDSKLFWPVVVL